MLESSLIGTTDFRETVECIDEGHDDDDDDIDNEVNDIGDVMNNTKKQVKWAETTPRSRSSGPTRSSKTNLLQKLFPSPSLKIDIFSPLP